MITLIVMLLIILKVSFYMVLHFSNKINFKKLLYFFNKDKMKKDEELSKFRDRIIEISEKEQYGGFID